MIEYRLEDGSTKFVYPQHVGQFELDFPNAVRIGGQQEQPIQEQQVVGWADSLGTANWWENSNNLSAAKNSVNEKPGEETVLGTIARMGGEYLESIHTGWVQGSVAEEYLEVQMGDHSPEAIEAMIKAGDKLNQLPPNERMIEFAKKVNEAGGGFWNGLWLMAKEDKILASQVALQSAVMMLRAGPGEAVTELAQGKRPDMLLQMAQGAGVGALSYAAIGAGVGAAATAWGGPFAALGAATGGVFTGTFGAMAGTLGGLSLGMERGMTFVELLKEEIEAGGEEYNKESIRRFLEDDEKYLDIRDKAVKRGLTIGFIDLLSGGLAGAATVKTGKVLAKTAMIGSRPITQKLAQIGAGTVVEGAMGGVGEYFGQKAAGQEYNAADIILEAFAETPGAMVTSVPLAIARKPVYSITEGEGKNKRKINYTKKEFLEKIEGLSDESIALLDIDIKNDDIFASELFNRQNDFIIRSQIDERVPDGPEKDRLVELQKEKQKVEKDAKLKGIRKKPGAENRLKEIIAEMDAIIDKFSYTEFDPTTRAEVKERKRIKKEVGEARTRIFMDKLNQKLAKQGKKQLSDIKDLAAYVEKETGKVFNIKSGTTEDFFKYQMQIDDRVEDQTYREGLQSMYKGVLEDPNSTTEEKNEASQILEQIEKEGILKEIPMMAKGDAKQFGNMTPVFNEDGSIASYDIFINEEKAFKANGDLNVAAHEFFHGAIFSTLKGNIQAQMVVGNALISALKAGDVKLKPGSQLNELINQYTENEGLGEEILTQVSSAMQRGELVFNESFTQKLRDMWRQFGQKYFGKEIRFDTDQDVLNFVKDFNKTIDNPSKINKAFFAAIEKGIEGKLLEGIDIEGGPKVGQVFSKVNPRAQQFLDLEIDNKSLVDITQSPQSSQEDKFGAAEALVEKNWPIISKSLKFDPNGDIPMQAVKDAINEQILGIFPQVTLPDGSKINRNKPLFDTYNKENEVTTFLDATLRNRQAEIFTRARAIGGIEKMGVDISEAKDIKAPTPTKKKRGPVVVKEKILLETLGEKELQNEIRRDVVEIGVEGVEKYLDVKKEIVKHRKFMKDGTEITPELKAKYKKEGKPPPKELKSKRVPIGKFYSILEKVAAKYGITDPIRLITEKDFDTKQRKKAQDYILSKRDEHIVSLPEGTTKAGDPTGIAQTALGKAFFKAGGRARFAQTGTGKGLKEQAKQRINPMDYLEIFGLIPGSRINNSSVDPALRSQIIQTAVNATRQAIQQEQDALELSKESIDKLKDGKSAIMYAKDPAENIRKDKDGKYTANANLFYPNGMRVTLLPKDKVWIEKENLETGEITGGVISIKQMQSLWNEELGITWEKHMSNRLNNFLKSKPQYYNVLRELLTGGVKRAAFMNVNNFEALIPKTKLIQETDQVQNGRLNYHKALTKKQKEAGLKGKRLIKNITKLDTSIDKDKFENFIDFFQNVSSYLNDGQNMLDLWMMEEFLLHSSIDQNNFFRKSAPLLGYPIDDKGNPITTEMVIEEHTPINEVIKMAMGAAIRGNVKNIKPLLESLLSQMSILSVDDPGGNLKSSMGKDFYKNVMPRIIDGSLKLKPGHAGIYRLMKHGVNPFRYKLIESGKTIAQEFNVDNLSVEEAKQKIIDYFEGKVSLEYNTQMAKVPLRKGTQQNSMFSKAMSKARKPSYSMESRGITVLDFDDTLATTKSLVRYTAPDGTKGTLNAEQYASKYQDLLEQGYKFDFTEFDKVVKAKLAPLFKKALKLQKKFGPDNMFILTARPPAAQKAIYDFLKANGLNIPIKNITGLGNSTAEAKALWIADKVGEGYNDFYFADDALQNVQAVQNMLDQFDVKSKVQQARTMFSKNLDKNFNDILENVIGIESKKRFSTAKARKRGEGKGRFRFFIPPSHEDFVGLLYNFIGKGEKGNQHRNFFEQALVKPLNRAFTELNAAKQSISNDYRNLIKTMPDVRKKLTKKTPDGDFTYGDAIRVYLWQKAGFKVPGLSETDLKELSDLIKADPKLQAFADTLGLISKQKEGYVKPTEEWEVGDVRTDLADATMGVGRKQFFGEFIENADVIFSTENLNKIEAAYGKNFREALEDMLYRIKTGRNRPTGSNRLVNRFTDWINGAVGSTMFLNARSGILQQLSIVNFINYGDNNIFKASAAFANQIQYWKDYAKIFNSDFLKQRRRGIGFDVNGAELARAVSKSKEPFRAAIRHLLQKGFILTQLGDSNAIAMGGATFYRNRVNTYLKQGLTKKEAEAKAWTDFVEIAEMTQQSARPDMISQQQSSPLGKFILAFQNTPSQYNRFGIKKPMLDLINRRKTPPYTTQWQSDMSNISRILYYGTIQNLIFYGLQSAIFALAFSDDDEDKEFFEKKRQRIINGSIDSVLRGMGVGGAIVSTLKNTAMKIAEEQGKTWGGSMDVLTKELLQLSPPLGIKARKLGSAERTMKIDKKVIKEMETFDIDNPVWDAVSNVIEGTTNIPVHRLHRKVENLRGAQNAENEWWQRLFLGLGWGKWELGVEDNEIEAIKKDIKKRNKKKKGKGYKGWKSW